MGQAHRLLDIKISSISKSIWLSRYMNDASALKKSDVGIAMSGVVSDIAVEAADIVLVKAARKRVFEE